MLFCSDTVTHCITLQARLALSRQLRLTLNSRPSWLGFSKCRDLRFGEPGLAVVSVCGDDSPRMVRLCVCVRTRVWVTSTPIHTLIDKGRCDDVQLCLRCWGAQGLPGSYSNQNRQSSGLRN